MAPGSTPEPDPIRLGEPAATRPAWAAQPQDRQKRLVLRAVRIVFISLLATVTLLWILRIEGNANESQIGFAIGYGVTLSVALLFGVGVIAVDLFTPSKKISTLTGVGLGLVIAIMASIALGFIIDLIAEGYLSEGQLKEYENIAPSAKVIVGICLAYLAVSTVIQTQDDFRLVIPYVEFAKQVRGLRPLILDTSALVDARIEPLALTGIVQSPIVIPVFVVHELQQMADSADPGRRSKGRRGLDVITRLQRSAQLDVTIDETPVPGKAVDQMLVHAAAQTQAVIVTTDTGLVRVASIRGVETLNLFEVASAMRPTVAPGEDLSLRIVKPGEQEGQGVGYLDDGTMVVVEDARRLVGQTVDVEVTSTTQTAAGRMLFARHHEPEEPENGSGEPVGLAAREPNLPDRPARRKGTPRNPRRA